MTRATCVVNKCDSCKRETQELRTALHYWLKRIHLNSLSRLEIAQFNKDYRLSGGDV